MNLDGVSVDYENIVNVFSKIYNYKVLINRNQSEKVKGNNNTYQLKWTCKDIRSFMNKARFECEAHINMHASQLQQRGGNS